MKKLSKLLLISLISIFSLGFFVPNTYAEGEEQPAATSIRLMPVSKILQLSSSSTYDDKFEVFNDGSEEIRVEVYAAPYSYVYSDSEDLYKLGFNNENNFTQITRWISFLNDGAYSAKTTYKIPAGQSLEVNFRVTTPADIPAGGQYAVIFAHALSNSTSASGIRTEASPGIVVYGRSTEGEVKSSAEIRDLIINQSITENETTRNNFNTSAKIKNTGNVDFTATGRLTVEPIIGSSVNCADQQSNEGSEAANRDESQPTSRISVIPEAELILTDECKNTPSFGIYKVTWTVTAAGQTETVERTIFLIPIWLILIAIILLTILTIWIIIRIRKRKERRSRLAI